MKNAQPDPGAARDADGATVLVGDPPPFPRIITYGRVSFGSKRAELTVEIDGVGSLQLDLFVPKGREPFVAPHSIRSKFTGAYERTFRIDDAFAAAVLSAIVERDPGVTEPQL